MTNALVLYLQKPKLDPSSSKCSYYWVTIYISKIIHFAYNSFNYNTVSKRIIVGTALRRCPVSRGYTQRAEPPLEGVAATHKTSFAATALAVSSPVPYNRHRRLEK